MKSFSSYHAGLIFAVSLVGTTCGQVMSFNIYGQYIPDSYCKLGNESRVELGITERDSFSDIQRSIMVPKSSQHPNDHNCIPKSNLTYFKNGTCDEYEFDTSIMTNTIGNNDSLFMTSYIE